MSSSVPLLRTPRLDLRPLCAADAPALQASFAVWDVVRYFSRKRISWPYPDDGAAQYLARVLPEVAAGKRLLWAICAREVEDSPLVGVIELSPHSAGDQRSFWIAPAWQGLGLMSEAAAVVTDYAFDVKQLDELVLVSADANTPSVRLKQHSGAVPIAHGVGRFVAGDLPVTRWLLTRAAWHKNRALVMGRVSVWHGGDASPPP